MSTTHPELGEEDQLVMTRIITPEDDKLSAIIKLSKRLIELGELKAQQAEAMNKTIEEEKNLAERLIPDAMSSIGLSELRTASGHFIQLKTDYYASIPKAKSEAAFEWLRSRNMGGVIKESLSVDKSQAETLVAAQVPFTVDASVHPSTLKALVREQIEAGNEFPRELFGVHVANKAVVKSD